MHASLQPILDLLDEGLRLYRRHVVSFLLLAAVLFVPVAIGIGATVAAASMGFPTLAGLLTFVWLLLALPLAIYLVSGISRAALAAHTEQPVRVSTALSLHPLRALGMSVFAFVFYLVANTVSSALIFCIICPLITLMSGVIGGVSSLGFGGALGGSFAVALGVLFGIGIVLLYGLALVLAGAIYAGLVYSLQAFIQEQLSFGKAFARGFELLGYQFGRNLLAFVLTSAVFGATGIAVTLAIGVILPLPLLWLLGDDSPVAQSISASAWLLGLIFVLPPLPIWMALLYRRNLARREGWELEMMIVSSQQAGSAEF